MSNPYKAIFSVSGAKGFSSAAFVARLPVAMAPIGIVTMLSQSRGEYWLAGAVAATFTLANALAAPQISRLVDRLGQSRLLIPTTVLAVAAFALITTLPLLLADTVSLLGLTIFLSGIAVSPTFITAYSLVERRVPPAVLTEGVTWVGTGTGMGMAFGAFVSGWVVDNFGARNGLWVSIGAATIALLIVMLGQPVLAGARARSIRVTSDMQSGRDDAAT